MAFRKRINLWKILIFLLCMGTVTTIICKTLVRPSRTSPLGWPECALSESSTLIDENPIATLHVEPVPFEYPLSTKFFLHFTITNKGQHPIGIELMGYDEMISPSRWIATNSHGMWAAFNGQIGRGDPSLSDARRMSLLLGFKERKLIMVQPGESFNYFKDSYVTSRMSPNDSFYVIIIEGNLYVTDGQDAYLMGNSMQRPYSCMTLGNIQSKLIPLSEKNVYFDFTGAKIDTEQGFDIALSLLPHTWAAKRFEEAIHKFYPSVVTSPEETLRVLEIIQRKAVTPGAAAYLSYRLAETERQLALAHGDKNFVKEAAKYFLMTMQLHRWAPPLSSNYLMSKGLKEETTYKRDFDREIFSLWSVATFS